MLKKMLFALVPMVMLVSAVRADDDLLADVSVADIQDASIVIEEPGMDVNVDGLLAEADDATGDEAIEACFRSFGYRSHGYGYGGYGYGYNCYRPCYYNPCYTSYYVYRPVTYYHYCAPVYSSYWGCW